MAIGTGGRVYHWKHGWIPLTHAAALAKAKGNKELAQRLVPKPIPAHVMEYHNARQAQDRRFEAANGSVGVHEKHTQEYKDYFGVGDHAGHPVEKRVTFRQHLMDRKGNAATEREHARSYGTGHALGLKHAANNTEDPAKQDGEFDALEQRATHKDTFNAGYTDGIVAGYAKRTDLTAATGPVVDLAITPGGRVGDATPLGHGSGPRRLTDYVREVAHALMRDHGMTEGHAIAVARNQIRKWSTGGGKVHPAVIAGATASEAQQMILDHARRKASR